MKRPKGRKRRSPDADRTPPGGRALERVQQDRRARGLPPARVPGTLSLETDSPTVPRPRGAAAPAKSAQRSAKKTRTAKTSARTTRRKTARTSAKTAKKK